MRFLNQPAENNRLGDLLKSNLEKDWSRFRAAVAFVKRSGTKHIANELVEFSKKNNVEIIAGIDHQGTSKEGLEQLLNSISSNDRLIVFHNRLAVTFHPKVYLFANDTSAEIFVGSGNLTQGGLFTNYEASVHVELDLSLPNDIASLKSVEGVLDDWGNLKNGTSINLDAALLSRLVAGGLVPPEALTRPEKPIANAGSGTAKDQGQGVAEALFKSVKVPPPPSSKNNGSGTKKAKSAGGKSTVSIPKRAVAVAKPPPSTTGFVMTLQQTDVGSGQTTKGTAARSPEIFIPLAALREQFNFWQFPAKFVEDLTWTKKLDKDGRGKMDRPKVKMRIGGDIIEAALFYNPNKGDFRVRHAAIRSAGNVGDILRIEKVAAGLGYEYYIEIVPNGTTQHPVYLARCVSDVRNSIKKYGYY